MAIRPVFPDSISRRHGSSTRRLMGSRYTDAPRSHCCLSSWPSWSTVTAMLAGSSDGARARDTRYRSLREENSGSSGAWPTATSVSTPGWSRTSCTSRGGLSTHTCSGSSVQLRSVAISAPSGAPSLAVITVRARPT